MRVYTILVSQENDMYDLMGKEIAYIIKRNRGGVVHNGYDVSKYVTCLAFASMLERNRVASEFVKRGITFDIRGGDISDNGMLKLKEEER